MLNLLLFPDGQDCDTKSVGCSWSGSRRQGALAVRDANWKVRAPQNGWIAVARLTGVAVMEMARRERERMI